MQEVFSTCRICTALCGMSLNIDSEGRLASLRGDRSHPVSCGYACSKGLAAAEMLNDSDRLLQPMKRMPDGSYRPIALETALDEIAEQLSAMIEESGSESIALFKGTQSYQNATASQMFVDWMAALDSPNFYTTSTIDQSSHMVTMERMGRWNAGKHSLEDSDVALLVGTNPLVSVGGYYLLDFDPARRLKAAKRRGMKLIVVDPRRTETAMQADCHLQPVPGEDPTILAGLIRLILKNGWHDSAFCAQFVEGSERLRAAVEPFTPNFVEQRAGVGAETLENAAAIFARDSKRGIAIIGTGGTMAPRSNLSDHLVEALNVLCGRLRRVGERVTNPGVLAPPRRFRAEVIPPSRSWEKGPKTSTGHGMMFNQRMAGILADEMLLTGPGRIRALFVNGANPAVALPDQVKAVAGLRRLDLLVAVEPFMTATAILSHYIFPPKLVYERVDIAKPPELEAFLGGPPFNQYLPAVVAPPAGAQVIDDWYLYWAIAKWLRLPLSFAGVPLDLESEPPSTDDLLDIQFRNARVSLDVLRRYPKGHIFDDEPVFVEPGDAEAGNRFEIAPDDVVAELGDVVAEGTSVERSADLPFRLIVRRIRPAHNSMRGSFPEARKRGAQNPLYVHPEDLDALGLSAGDRVMLAGQKEQVSAIVAADATMRRGVVSMTHCWGQLPDDDDGTAGVSTSRLVRTDHQVEPINAMPAMTAIPVRIVADPQCARAAECL